MPDPRWLLTALAFPPAGYLGHLLSGPVDSPTAAVIGGLVTGSLIGAAQWAVLRRYGVGAWWIVATALGLAGGLAVGAAAVGYATSTGALVAMGALSGLGVGAAQSRLLSGTGRQVRWTVVTGALWALGWLVSNAIGIAVDEQFVVFGLSGAAVAAVLHSSVVRPLVMVQATS